MCLVLRCEVSESGCPNGLRIRSGRSESEEVAGRAGKLIMDTALGVKWPLINVKTLC